MKIILSVVLAALCVPARVAALADPKWMVFGASQYAYFNETMAWDDAQRACNALKGEGGGAEEPNLVSLYSKEEHDFVTQQLTRGAEGSIWLGCVAYPVLNPGSSVNYAGAGKPFWAGTGLAYRWNETHGYYNDRPNFAKSCCKEHNSGENLYANWLDNSCKQRAELSWGSGCRGTYVDLPGDKATADRSWRTSGCSSPRGFVCKAPYNVEWKSRGGAKYALIQYESSWENAQATCKSLESDSNLLAMEDEDEERYIQETFVVNRKPRMMEVWTGCHVNGKRNHQEDHFTWASTGLSCTKGECGIHTNWADGEPTANNGQRCVVINNRNNAKVKMQWNDVACNWELPFICEAKHDPVAWKNSRYVFYANTATWEQARWTCNRYHGAGADLVSIETQEEQDYLDTHPDLRIGNQTYWTGCSGKGVASEFTWSGNTKVCSSSTFANWDSGTLDASDSRCIASSPSTTTTTTAPPAGVFAKEAKWTAQPCNASFGFVCEIPCQDDLAGFTSGSHKCCSGCSNAVSNNPGAYCGGRGAAAACPATCKGSCPTKAPVPWSYPSLHDAECCIPSIPSTAKYGVNNGCTAARMQIMVCYRIRFTFVDNNRALVEGHLSQPACHRFATGSAASVAKGTGWDCFHGPGFEHPAVIPAGANGTNLYRVDPDDVDQGCFVKTIATSAPWYEEKESFLEVCPSPSNLKTLPINSAEANCASSRTSTSTTSTTATTTTIDPASTTCLASDGLFKCASGDTCIKLKYVCDGGDPDCADGSDEMPGCIPGKSNTNAEDAGISKHGGNLSASIGADEDGDGNKEDEEDSPSIVGPIVGGVVGLLLVAAIIVGVVLLRRDSSAPSRGGTDNPIYDGNAAKPDTRAFRDIVVNGMYAHQPSTTEAAYADVDADGGIGIGHGSANSSGAHASADFAEVAPVGGGNEENHYEQTNNTNAPQIRGGSAQQQGGENQYNTLTSTAGRNSQPQRESTNNTLSQRGNGSNGSTNNYDDVTYDAMAPAHAASAAGAPNPNGQAALYAVPMKGARLRADSKAAAKSSNDVPQSGGGSSDDDLEC